MCWFSLYCQGFIFVVKSNTFIIHIIVSAVAFQQDYIEQGSLAPLEQTGSLKPTCRTSWGEGGDVISGLHTQQNKLISATKSHQKRDQSSKFNIKLFRDSSPKIMFCPHTPFYIRTTQLPTTPNYSIHSRDQSSKFNIKVFRDSSPKIMFCPHTPFDIHTTHELPNHSQQGSVVEV